MTLVHRHNAKSKEQTTTSDTNQSAFRTVTRSYAQALSIPTLSIRIPEPIATHNSYSTLNDTVTSDSSMDSDKYTWNSPESSDSVESDTDDMPPLIESNDANDANDASDEYSDTDYSDMPPLIESNDSESSISESSDSDQEIIVNHTRYQRVRKSCKDSLPCPITFFFRLWAIAMFMQFVLHICSVTNDRCSRTL
jgi:hypothetical protein